MLLLVLWYSSIVLYDSSPDTHFTATCYHWTYDIPVLYFMVPPQTHTSQPHVTVGPMIIQYCFLWFLPRRTLQSHMLQLVLRYSSSVFYGSSTDTHFKATCYCWSYDIPVLFFMFPPQTHTSQPHVTLGPMILQYCFLWFLPRHTLHSHMLLLVLWYSNTVFYGSSPDTHFTATCYCWSYDTPILFFKVPPQTHSSMSHVNLGFMILHYIFMIPAKTQN